MRKLMSAVLVLVLLFSCIPIAYAEDLSRAFDFVLSVDGSDIKQVNPGDIVTVVFYLNRTDKSEPYEMYAMQNEIRYDGNFFRLIEGGTLLSSGIQTRDLGLRDSSREFYMNFVSMSGGEQWETSRQVGSIQLEVIGQSGLSKITNQDYHVSTADGTDHYLANCQDVTIVISTECTVRFETNGGSDILSRTVHYGEKISCPEDPVRKGYHLEGWYSDLDLQNQWNFDQDTVQGNMVLYAKWAEGDPALWISWLWWLPILVLLAMLLMAVLFLSRKNIRFETGCREKIKSQRVRKGGFIIRPADPRRIGRTFAGWYQDSEKTVKWNFETDTVQKNMTLYAKWV